MKYELETLSGFRLDYLNPDPNSIHIYDIAHALSHLCRFGGQIGAFYSVAEHSIYCWKMAFKLDYSYETQLAVLLHDASEAYCVDVPRQLKKLLTGYSEIEDRIQKVIANKYGFQYPYQDIVHKIDNTLLMQEANYFKFNCQDWNFGDVLECCDDKLDAYLGDQDINDIANVYMSIFKGLQRVMYGN